MHRRICRLVIASVFLGFSPLVHSQPTPNPALPVPESYFPGLKSLLDEAVRQSPRMIARNTEEALSDGYYAIARAEQLPRVSGYLNYLPLNHEERKGDPRSPYTSQKSSYALNLVQPLYHWGALHDNTRIAELQRRIVQGQTVEAYRLLVSEIRSGYLQLVVKKAGLGRTRTSLRLTEDQLALAQEKFGKGQISETELFEPTLGAEQARLMMDRVIEDFEWSKKTFARLYGGAPLSDEQIPDAIPDISVPLEEFEVMLAEFAGEKDSRSHGLRILRDQIESEKLNYQIANTRLKPKVNFLLGTSQDEQSYTANIGEKYGVTSYYTGVRVEWSIFDGFATRGMKSNALVRHRQLERNYENASAQLIDGAKSKLRQLQFSVRGLAITRKQLQASDERFQRIKDEVARGLVSPADLRSSEFVHSGAVVDAYSARSECLLRATDFISTILADPALANLPSSLR